MAPTNRIGAIASRAPVRIASRPSYVCLQCRLVSSQAVHKSNPSSIYLPSRRHASGFINTEKWRKKIWGSENPPGQEDPYGAPGVLDQRAEERVVVEPESAKQVDTDEEELDDVEDYKRATTWEGLERVGYSSWGKEQFNMLHPFEGFMDPKLESREKIVVAVHRALVEVFALKQAGLPLVMDYDAGDVFLDNVDDFLLRLAKEAKFEIDATGEWRLVLEKQELEGDIIGSITPRADVDEDEEGDVEDTEEREKGEDLTEGEQSEEMVQKEDEDACRLAASSPATEPQAVETESLADYESSHHPSAEGPPTLSSIPDHVLLPEDNNWRNMSLEDPEIKFAVLKRVMQLTGTRIPDPVIADIKNTKLLLSHLLKKTKAKKLAENLVAGEAADLPNVQILERRYTFVHKEKELGRWKMIEQELEKRGLPVPGRRIRRTSPERVQN
ncbi:hypothetical protein N7G274_000732 [Stereocaulon virgatum]|uniref:Large ribosomal subunit protein mL50 n=1 Tax=Stereocaulon virgatum TaxID=373712 RepID=A0ABR4APP6_9LECA